MQLMILKNMIVKIIKLSEKNIDKAENGKVACEKA